MEEDNINFAEVFSNNTFEGLRKAILMFLKKTGATNTSLEFEDKTVYIHARKDAVEIHIVTGDKSEAPELPQEPDNINDMLDDDE